MTLTFRVMILKVLDQRVQCNHVNVKEPVKYLKELKWTLKNCRETMETVRDFILGAPKSLQMVTAAAAAKLLQSCLTLCDPIDGSLLGSSIPGILQARTVEWVAISFSNA